MTMTISLLFVAFNLVIVFLILIYASSKSDIKRTEYCVRIKAPPEQIFPLIDDLRAWDSWLPSKNDHGVKKVFRGAEKGVGACYEWEGNDLVGKGRLEIIESSPPAKIALKLNLITRFKINKQMEFILEPRREYTKLTWALCARQSYFAKLLDIFLSYDKQVERDFDCALRKLKVKVEKS
jgi:hypothetical protein